MFLEGIQQGVQSLQDNGDL